MGLFNFWKTKEVKVEEPKEEVIDWNEDFNIVKFYGDTVMVHNICVGIMPTNIKKLSDKLYQVKIDIENEPVVGDIVCGYLYGDQDIYIYKKEKTPLLGQRYGGYNWKNYKVI